MNATGASYELLLANGCRITFGPCDASAAGAVDRFAAVMGLPPCGEAPQIRFSLSSFPDVAPPNGAPCGIPEGAGPEGLFVQLSWMSAAVARKIQDQGGLFLHAGLAERDGRGVALAAPGGMGKTTASRRLPAPWRSLSDDQTLVVFGPDGPLAHPWPTWSRFLDGGTGGAWDVTRYESLEGVFFLQRGGENAVEPVGKAEAAAMIMESTEQMSIFLLRGLPGEEVRRMRTERFASACRLAAGVPTFTLRLTLSGAFWNEIEEALAVPCGCAAVLRSQPMPTAAGGKCV